MHCHQASILNVLIEAAVADFNFHVNIEDSMSGIQAWNQKKNTENLFPRAANDLSPRLGVGIIISITHLNLVHKVQIGFSFDHIIQTKIY